MHESTITPEGQITLPEPVLEALSLKPGDQVRYFIYEGEVRVLAVRPVTWLSGALHYDGPPKSLEEMDDGIAEAACESARS